MKFNLKSVSLISLLLLALASYNHALEPVVQTPLGFVKGSLMQTRLNRTIYAFRGLRYGKSTEGERRFKQAEPVDPWNDVFDASKEGPSCSRPGDAGAMTTEDCLRLNVFSAKLPDSNSSNEVKRPVIVFFHPGGFYGFSGQSFLFGPQYYLDKDIVLVTVNYRLATLGFIATGDARAPGNLGLKDQVEALRWIQKNIESFGGDPNSVSLTGYSAGGWSNILHMLSPMSKGLFHRVIASSGTPINLEGHLPTEQKNLVIKQASFVGCPTDSLDTAFECLKTVPHQKLADTLRQFREWYDHPMLIWSPVVEPEVPGVERFLPAQPVDLIRAKKIHQVPLIIGLNKDEFSSMFLAYHEKALKGDDTYFRDLDKQWDVALPFLINFNRCCSEHSTNISHELRKAYLGNEPPSVKNINILLKLFWDSFNYNVHRTAQLIAQNTRAPVYSYLFTYQGRYSFAVWRDTKKPYGVVHHDDLQYLYVMNWIVPFLNANDPEIGMVERMTTMWSHFAETGEPIPKNDDKFQGVNWQRVTSTNDYYLDIGEELELKSLSPEKFALWERLFPLPAVSSSHEY